MLKIPKLVYEDIEPDAFRAECGKMMPATAPKWGLSDIVLVDANFGRRVPGVVAGVESRQDRTWHYTIIRPRGYDGVLERTVLSEEHCHAFDSKKD